ncbi:hypothetical protein [Streptomyces europaeiscabiei]|uniref:hypothetical protein n=1 Tax=Streptomyces europaeiscabiei TaxID=146819 RepID=UPI002E159175|nr:hypothetical protein OHB30_20785 [Streptomyces europaeiscabiei]
MITGASASPHSGIQDGLGTGTSRMVLTGWGGRRVMTDGVSRCSNSFGEPGW